LAEATRQADLIVHLISSDLSVSISDIQEHNPSGLLSVRYLLLAQLVNQSHVFYPSVGRDGAPLASARLRAYLS
jgi:hypothetical protein